MKVLIEDVWFEDIKKFLTREEQETISNRYRYQSGKGKSKLNIEDWTDSSLDKLFDFLGVKADEGDRSAKMSQTIVRQWIEIKNNPNGQVVGRLENVEPAMKKYIATSPNRYVFHQEPDGNFVPWFVNNIAYEAAGDRNPANVTISLAAINTGTGSSCSYRGRRGSGNGNGEGTSFTFYVESIRKKRMSQILESLGYYLETHSRMESYKKEVETYLQHCDEDGFQMSVFGKAKLIKGWSSASFRTVGQAGRPAKMVMDPPERERGEDTIHAAYWDKNEEKVWMLPIHPVYEMFDLDEHADYRVHVNNATPYVYDDTVDQKLILEDDVKDFLTVLIEHSKNTFEDIVGGKEGGTIVLIEGCPGVGKTLSAEVYSEKMHRPLYKVQSSQLGTTPEKVEEQLKEVLQRSERWGAILLIDEADVYVRARGYDIRQNAIVGVFLRMLEYYRGVLFMTTNLGNEVDDAIISRCTARFMYEMPDTNAQKKLWHVMTEQNKVGLTDKEIDQIVKTLPELSGRDIKNLLKLAMVLAMNTGERVTPKSIKFVSRFKQSGKAKVAAE